MIQQETIVACKDGNRDAYNQLYNGCIAYVYSTIKRYISESEDIKDVVQNVFAKVFIHIDSFDSSKGTWNSWIRKIAVTQSLMHLRKNKNLSLMSPIEDTTPENSIDESKHLDRLNRKDIDKMLSNMPNGYKVVFMLSVLDGYNHTEISEALNITKETSRSQLNRAKKWLKKQISNDLKYKAYGLL